MLGEDQLGTVEMGAGAITILDPGPVEGYEATSAPVFRTARVPGLERTFVVPASDRYADLMGRVGGIVVPSKLDFKVDWRTWLQGDVVIKSNWTNALGDRVDNVLNIEAELPDAITDDSFSETVTYNGQPVTTSGDPLTVAVTYDSNADGSQAESNDTIVQRSSETRVGSGSIRAGVTSIVYEVRGTSPILLKNAVETARGRKDERTMVLRGSYITSTSSFEQDPGAVLDYRVSFANLLEPKERLYGTVSDMLLYRSRPYFALTPGMVFVSRTLLDRECIVWLRGGVVGKTYLMTVGFNTSGGKTVYGQFAVTIKEK